MPNRIYLIVFLLVLSIAMLFSPTIRESDAQDSSLSIFEPGNASNFVQPSLINKKQIIKLKEYNDREEITYLGTINDNRDVILYHVLTVFRTVQAAIVVHGHSNIIYLDKDKNIARQYEVGGPEDLPFKLEKNALYFHLPDSNKNHNKTYIFEVGTTLPKVICIAPNDCY